MQDGAPEDADDLGLVAATGERDASAPEHRRLRSLVEDRLFRNKSGLKIGRYSVLRTVGKGGMGVVYEAFDPELDRKVAIKLVRSEEGGTEGRSRLQREAQVMARLTHPNVVQVYDVGTHEEQVYVVMELVDGLSLRRWLELKERGPKEVLDKLIAAGRGLAAAHAIGMVHRDFKPDNVLLGEGGRVLVSDFGLARSANQSDQVSNEVGEVPEREVPEPGDSAITQAGIILGTPAYMAPEQLYGEGFDARADQFAFCVSLYEALFGVRPFAGKGKKRVAAIARRRLTKPLRDVTVAPRVQKTLARGLSADPSERFASMEELLGQLDEPEAGRRAWIVAGLGVAALAAAGVGFSLAGQRTDPCASAGDEVDLLFDEATRARIATAFDGVDRPYARETKAAVIEVLDGHLEAWRAAREDACRATHERREQSEHLLDLRMACLDERLDHTAAIVELFSSADLEVVSHANRVLDSLPTLSACGDVASLLDRTPPPPPDQRATLESLRADLNRARALNAAGKFPAALELANGIEPQVQSLGYRPLEAELYNLIGALEHAGGHDDQSTRAFREAARAAAAARDRRLELEAWRGLALSVGPTAEGSELAVSHLDQAEALLEALGGNASLEIELINARAVVALDGGDFREGLEHAEAALRLADTEQVDASAARMNRAIARSMLGEFDGAIGDFESLLARARLRGAASHPRTANLHLNLASALYFKGRYEEAVEHQLEALRIYESNFGEVHADVAMVRSNIGLVYSVLGQTDRAIEYIKRASEIAEKALGTEHAEYARTVSSLAAVYGEIGRTGQSLELHQRALEIRERVLGREHPDVALDLTGVAAAKLALDAPEESLPLLERALAIYAERPGEPGDQASTEFALARTLGRLDRDEERARGLARQARERYATTGPRGDKHIAQIDAWLAAER